MKIVATIEARMTSSRLPGKVLLPAAGKPLLEHLVNRLKKVPQIDEIVLATTINQTDDILVNFAENQNITYFRGSEEDVMQRVINSAESVNADVIVGITGDCPIIDPIIVEQTIQMFLHHHVDYVSNGVIRCYPDGMDTQVFALETLKRSATMTNEALDHEHPTLHIQNNPELFSYIHLLAPVDLWWSDLGLTLDEPADYELLKNIIEYFGEKNPYFSCAETINLLRSRPHWVDINRAVARKGAT
jgi:spore coat polysaccharide biosynthesis protein SpsF